MWKIGREKIKMKRIRLKRASFIILVCGALFLSSCEAIKKFFYVRTGCFNIYESVFEKGAEQKKQILFKGARDCLKKEEFRKAVFLFEKLLLSLKRIKSAAREAVEVEKKLAEISFYKTKNYEKALKYYIDLLKKPLELKERFLFQKQVAESFLYLKKYEQALREINKCFFKGISPREEKEAVFLKSRILVEKKAFDQALPFFESQIDKFPEEEKFFREYKAFIYEDKKDFLSAIEELEKVEPTNSFIKQKIWKLRERQNNQPGF